jgi:septum formation protein
LPDEAPRDYVLRVARAKAAVGWKRMRERNLPRHPVLAADTTVALGMRIFGKPSNRRDAETMLAELSGKRHEVLTAVVVQYDDQVETALSASEVQFRELTPQEIQEYVATGESDDKAGAYAIQGRAALFVAEIRGSQSGIVGLPLYETAQLLQRMGASRERRGAR